MVEFQRRQRVAGGVGYRWQTYTLRTEAEARAEGIAFVPWREVQPGQWGLTDDGYVAECLAVQPCPPSRKGGTPGEQVVFSFGAPWRRSSRVDALAFVEARAFSKSAPLSWQEKESRRARARRLADLAAAQILIHGRIDEETLARAYRPTAGKSVKTLRAWLKTEKAQQMISDALKAKLLAAGLTEEGALAYFKDGLERARTDGKPGDMLAFWNEYAHLTGIKSEKGKVTEEFGFDYTREVGGRAETASVSARRTRELPVTPPEEADFGFEGADFVEIPPEAPS